MEVSALGFDDCLDFIKEFGCDNAKMTVNYIQQFVSFDFYNNETPISERTWFTDKNGHFNLFSKIALELRNDGKWIIYPDWYGYYLLGKVGDIDSFFNQLSSINKAIEATKLIEQILIDFSHNDGNYGCFNVDVYHGEASMTFSKNIEKKYTLYYRDLSQEDIENIKKLKAHLKDIANWCEYKKATGFIIYGDIPNKEQLAAIENMINKNNLL